MTLKTKQQRNLKIINSIKARLEQVVTTEFVATLGYSRQNLYKHLDEAKAAKANLEELVRISEKLDEYIFSINNKAEQIIQNL